MPDKIKPTQSEKWLMRALGFKTRSQLVDVLCCPEDERDETDLVQRLLSHPQHNAADDLRAKLLEVMFDHPASRDIQFAVLADLAIFALRMQFGGDKGRNVWIETFDFVREAADLNIVNRRLTKAWSSQKSDQEQSLLKGCRTRRSANEWSHAETSVSKLES